MQLLGHGEKGSEVSQLHAGMISLGESFGSELILDWHALWAFDDIALTRHEQEREA
jgi:hypothetical protein